MSKAKSYRRKPTPVEAFKYEGRNSIPQENGWLANVQPFDEDPDSAAWVCTLHGKAPVYEGDCVVRSENGGYWPVVSEEFEANYERFDSPKPQRKWLSGITVVLDFDGVLHSYVSGWQGFVPGDPPEEGALSFCRRLVGAGARLVVCSARAREEEGLGATRRWLREYGFPEMEVTNEKPPGHFYIDDRAIRYEGSFEDVERIIWEKA